MRTAHGTCSVKPMRATALFAALLVSFLPAAHAQFADVSHAGGPVAVTAPWRFHTGDNPQWAQPGFDDSHWSLMRMDRPWAEQGYKGISGFAWYRIKVKLPAGEAPHALAFREISLGDEIYADGALIGTIGQLRPSPVYRSYSYVLHPFPLPAALNGKTVEFAIRTWLPAVSATDTEGNGRSVAPQIGNAQAIAALCELSNDRYLLAQEPDWLSAIIAAGIGLFSLGLFLLRRHAPEYAWAALYLVLPAVDDALYWFNRNLQFPNAEYHLADAIITSVMLAAWLLFVWRFVRIHPDRLLYAALAAAFVPSLTSVLTGNHLNTGHVVLVWGAAAVALGVLVLVRLASLARLGNREAQLLLVPFLLSCAEAAFYDGQFSLYRAGIVHSPVSLAFYRGSSFVITPGQVAHLLVYLSVGAVLVLRFARTAERDERLSAEMQAAHSVQAQLVPLDLPATPHFRFEAAYFAASEVGGDFYQVLPQGDGSVLVAIGDVSGKGLKAAMLGTLVVGALRSLAQEDLPPERILARLNAQLAASTDGGFVTCCVARVSAEGLLTFANAGHLAPYRNQAEIACESGLPLGLIASAEYAETAAELGPGDRLTFLSDGVAEARNLNGELFGFERTRAISAQSAEQIATAAQAFGQQDDITVLTLTVAPVEVLHV